MIRPLQNRILVQPDVAPTETESGLILPESGRRDPVMSGTVLAVGRGPSSAHRVRGATIAEIHRLLDAVAERVPTSCIVSEMHDELANLSMSLADFSDVKEGDTVCFGFTAGSEITVDGQRAILLNEEELQAVWTPDEVTA